jgi:sulfur carrier protein ThiS
MRFSSHFERSEAESRNLFFNRFLHFGPLCGPPVEITKAHILIIIGITTNKTERKITMRILFINNIGGGYADFINVEERTTIEKLFNQKMSGGHAEDYLIRVNRQPVPKDYVLQENDRVTITPTKVEGAKPVLA